MFDEEKNPELLETVKSMLSDLTDDDSSIDIVQDADITEVVDEADSQNDDVKVVDESEKGASDDQDQTIEVVDDSESEAADNESPTLPAAIRRSLRSYEWTDDEIDEAFKRDPDGFLSTSSKIHSTRVKETQQWAAIGRAQRDSAEISDLTPDSQVSQQSSPNESPYDEGVSGIDFDKLSEATGFDKKSMMDAFGPLNTTIEALNALLPSLNAGVQSAEKNQQAELARQVDKFFQSDDLKPYSEFYGESWDNADNDQVGHRNEVLELADHIIVGAATHGRTLLPFEAMDFAHSKVASEVQESITRQKLASQLVERNRGITLKSNNKASSVSSEPPDRERILSNAAERLNKVFNNT